LKNHRVKEGNPATNDNPITAEKMVFMYTINSLIHGWWEKVTLIVWGATTKLVNENANI